MPNPTSSRDIISPSSAGAQAYSGEAAVSWAELQEWLRSELEQHRRENKAMLRQLQSVNAMELDMNGSTEDEYLKYCAARKEPLDDEKPLDEDTENQPEEVRPEEGRGRLVSDSSMLSADSKASRNTQRKNSRSSRKLMHLVNASLPDEDDAPKTRWRSFVTGPALDWFIAVVVVSNMLAMVAQAQWLGTFANDSINVGPLAVRNETVSNTFVALEYAFLAIYVVDLTLRLVVLRWDWLYHEDGCIRYANVFDGMLVVLNCLELLIPLALQTENSDRGSSVTNTLKLSRLTRGFRIIRAFRLFRQLKILLATCVASVGALFWSLVLLFMFKVIASLVVCASLQPFVTDDRNNYESRVWVNRYYGSFLKALYTMFEITYSGGWPQYVRPVVEDVSPWYALMFLLYITLVVFAVIRIITALFLKETLSCAANDAEIALDEKRQEAEGYRIKLHEVFHAADLNGDGMLSREEFDQLLANKSLREYMTVLDLKFEDVGPLFGILDDGDHQVTIEEFCDGLNHLKGQARAIDVVVLKHEVFKVRQECSSVLNVLDVLCQRLGCDKSDMAKSLKRRHEEKPVK